MSKYRAKRTTVDGLTFDSMGEARRWQELKLLARAGEIRHLERQIPYALKVKGIYICDYIADFRYFDCVRQERIVEDFKGFRTAEYLLKRKLMLACHGITILETGKRSKPRKRAAPRRVKEAA